MNTKWFNWSLLALLWMALCAGLSLTWIRSQRRKVEQYRDAVYSKLEKDKSDMHAAYRALGRKRMDREADFNQQQAERWAYLDGRATELDLMEQQLIRERTAWGLLLKNEADTLARCMNVAARCMKDYVESEEVIDQPGFKTLPEPVRDAEEGR